MLIAVGVDENDQVSPHLGKTKLFMIFDRVKDDVKFVEMRKSSGEHKDHMIEDIKDCKFIISGQMGNGMFDNLQLMGITPVIETRTKNPIEAVRRL